MEITETILDTYYLIPKQLVDVCCVFIIIYLLIIIYSKIMEMEM